MINKKHNKKKSINNYEKKNKKVYQPYPSY